MIEKRIFSRLIRQLVFLLLIIGLCQGLTYGKETSFRDQFIYNYKNFDFRAQERLLNNSGDVIEQEVRNLIDEAMVDDVSLGQRMDMLDVASAMVSGYLHYHGQGKKLAKEIERLIRNELKKEKEKNDELMKWKKDEMFLGNFVMKENIKQMEIENVAPVVYPHWIHRIWFECRVCHDDLFPMHRWSNENSHEEMQAGKSCGVCHNGEMAFAVDKNCDSCHLAGKPEAEKLQNIEKLDHAHIKNVATRLGAEWNIENLPESRIPVDKYGFIDWLALDNQNISRPVNSLTKDFEIEMRINKIMFVSKSKLKNVVFDHEIHTTRINCLSCHPEVFRKNLENNVKMVKMSKGFFCGRCHGKVSFTFSDCLRCHSSAKDSNVEGALLHLGQQDKKQPH